MVAEAVKSMPVLLLASNLVMYHLSPCNHMTCLEELETHRESVPGVLQELWYCGGKKQRTQYKKFRLLYMHFIQLLFTV